MPRARLSSLKARPGNEDQVKQLIRENAAWLSTQPGYIHGVVMQSKRDPLLWVRFTLWEREEDMDAAAQSERNLALRSRLLMLGEETSVPVGEFEADIIGKN